MRDDAFFIGWSRALPPGLGRFLALVASGLLGGAVLLALLLGATADDPAGPDPRPPAEGPARVAGVLRTLPYPMLVTDDGRTLLLSGEGKRGAPAEAAGQRVRVAGYRFSRGGIGNIAVEGAPAPLGPAPAPALVPMGRWRITGEVCDGKCAAGAMRPGSGLAHRACAVLCIEGGLPPVLVPTADVAGHGYLLLADAAGGPIGPEVLALTGLRATFEGAVERIGDLLVLRVQAVR